MKNQIYDLEYNKSAEFVYGKLQGWGCIIDKVASEHPFKNGQFFCIAPEESSSESLYDFDTAMGMNAVEPYAEDLAIASIFTLLKDFPLFNLIVENNSTNPLASNVTDSGREYFLANDVVFYLLRAPSTLQLIQEYYRYGKGYGFTLMLSEGDIPILEIGKNVEESIIDKIASGVRLFMTSIYDSESFLIWSDQNYLVGVQQLFADLIKKSIDLEKGF